MANWRRDYATVSLNSNTVLRRSRLTYQSERWMIVKPPAAAANNESSSPTVAVMPYQYMSPVSFHPWLDALTGDKYAPVYNSLSAGQRSHPCFCNPEWAVASTCTSWW